jgi:cation:H+ antiporter
MRGQQIAIAVATAFTVPAAVIRLGGATLPAYVAPVIFGIAILASAFLLAWAAEVLQLDVSQGLALTVLALIAVLPEYAVDFTFAWKAGKNPEEYAPLALANMTGSNRLLIGAAGARHCLRRGARKASRKRKPTGRSTPTPCSSVPTRSRSRSSGWPRCTR